MLISYRIESFHEVYEGIVLLFQLISYRIERYRTTSSTNFRLLLLLISYRIERAHRQRGGIFQDGSVNLL